MSAAGAPDTRGAAGVGSPARTGAVDAAGRDRGKRKRRGWATVRFLLLPDLLGPAGRALDDALGVQRAVFGALRRPPGSERVFRRLRGWSGALGVSMALAGLAWILLAVLEMAAGSAPAAAQTVQVPDLSGEPDKAGRKLLAFLSDLDVTNNSALSNMLLIYAGSMLFLGGVLLAWWTVARGADTASEGRNRFTGKEILRIAVAFVLLVPFTDGLSSGQRLGLALARVGGDIAQLTWGQFSRDVLREGKLVAPPPHELPLRAEITSLFLVELCMRTANNVASRAGDQPYVAVDKADGKPEPGRASLGWWVWREDDSGRKRSWGYDGKAGKMPEGMCGGVQLTGIDGGRTAAGKMAEAHIAAFENLRPVVGAVADEVALWFAAPRGQVKRDTELPDIEQMLIRADPVGKYVAAVRASVSASQDEATDELEEALRKEAENNPWTMAGALFMTITRHVGRFHVSSTNVPKVGLPSARLSGHVKEAAEAVKAAAGQLAGSDAYPAALGAAEDPAQGSGGVGGIGRGTFDWLGVDSIQLVDSGNPILDLVSLGHSLTTKAMGALVVLGGVAGGANFLKSIPVIGGGLNAFEATWQVTDSFVSTILGLMMMAGLILAYLVPALPFIRFLFGLLAWLVAVVAAVFAIPVWLAGHMVRGDSYVTPATRQGWLFLPALVLRPVLMLFGLVVGYLLFVTVMDMFNDVFRAMVVDAKASEGVGVLRWLAMIGIYIMVVYGLMNGCFKLIDHLPSVAMEWIGGRDRGDGDADRLGGGIAGAFQKIGPMRVGQRPGGGRGG